MTGTLDFLAIDLGASSGRVLLGRWDGSRFQLEELYRFPNGPVDVLGHLHWDALRLWSEIKTGIAQYASRYSSALSGIGVDTWGVDYALLDQAGQLIGNPYHYRDSRTDGLLEPVFQLTPRSWIYQRTGIQFMQINTLVQLYSMVQTSDAQLYAADRLLMMPDLFHYWLTGEKASEYTIASTSQMLGAHTRLWDGELLARLGISERLLPRLISPGTILGNLRPEVMIETGLRSAAPVAVPAGHDTASAVAAIPDLDEHSVYISSGTWSLVGAEVPGPVINDQAMACNFTNEGGVGGTIRLLKNVAGLWLLQESRRQWQSEGYSYRWEELSILAEQAEPFRSLVNPDAAEFLSPGNMPTRLRAYCQRTGQPEPESVGQVARSCLESLALKYRGVINSLEDLLGRQFKVIRIVGGGSLNRLLCQFTADVCERLVIAGPAEATALGNLMIQAIATGCLANIAEGRQAVGASIERTTYEPASSAPWREAFERYQSETLKSEHG